MMSFEDSILPIQYRDPWDADLTSRLQQLASRPRRIAYFYEAADNSTFRYRVYNMVQVLNGYTEDISASYFFLDDLPCLSEIADSADILIICRTRYDHRVNHLIHAFHQRKKLVVFDTDDFVFNTDYAHLILSTLDQDLSNSKVWDDWFAYSSRIGATLKLCDAAITTNDFLAQQIRDFAHIPVSVIPNFLNEEQLQISKQIFDQKKHIHPASDGSIHLGYFSGSPSHRRDFEIVISSLEEVLKDDSRLCVVVAGYIEADDRLKKFGSRITTFPFCDFVNLQRLIGSVEFNLMPLQSNIFTNCKSELKYFEAAIVGTQSISSPTYTYARAIRHGHNGYIAQAHQWASVIKQAVNEIDNYHVMAARSYEDAKEKYACYNQAGTIRAAFKEITQLLAIRSRSACQ